MVKLNKVIYKYSIRQTQCLKMKHAQIGAFEKNWNLRIF